MPRRLLHPKKRTVGVRIPDHAVCQALLTELGEPLVTSSLILPGETEPRALGWEIKEELDHAVDLVVEAGETLAEPTTVVDWSEGYPGDRASRRRRPDAGSRSSRPAQPLASGALPREQRQQAHGVPGEEGEAVVGQAGDDGLDDAVVGARRSPWGR